MHRLVTLGIDALFVVVFAALGARTHHDGALSVLAVADVAWPFLAGLALVHLALAAAVKDPSTVVRGLAVWIATLTFGMALRQLTGDGTAFAFLVVATCFLGVTLVGWRAALAVTRR